MTGLESPNQPFAGVYQGVLNLSAPSHKRVHRVEFCPPPNNNITPSIIVQQNTRIRIDNGVHYLIGTTVKSDRPLPVHSPHQPHKQMTHRTEANSQ